MIIRPLRNNEQYKRDILFAEAFNMKPDIEQSAKEEMNLVDEVFYGAFKDDGETLMAQIAVIDYKTMYYGNVLTAAGIAGVSTLPEYRRCGCIREIFKYIFTSGEVKSFDTSFLYPFSYRYYRKYGYERLLQHKTLKFPFSSIQFIPRNDSGVLYKSREQLPELLELYNNYAKRYNVCFYRENGKYFCDNPFKTGKYTYMWYNNGKPEAYATFTIEGKTLNVTELVWLDKASLMGMLGFLRMYEGQVDDIWFSMLDKNNPLDLLVDTDRSSSFGMYDGVMGRFIDIKKGLELYPFPEKSGNITIEVTGDFIEANNGFYHVEYGAGKAQVSYSSTGKPDITVSVCSLSRILFGDIMPENLAFLPDTVIHNEDKVKDIFKHKEIIHLERF
jgi:predicted acetyltransferase